MKQRNGKVLCASHGCQRVATHRLTLSSRSNGNRPYPAYYCEHHALAVPAVRRVIHQYGFTVMMDFSPYFKDVVEES